MESKQARRNAQWASGGNVLAGVWLFLAPVALNYSGIEQAVWNDMVIGLAVFIIALARTAAPTQFSGISWVNTILGIWLIAAPFVLDYSVLDYRPAEEGAGPRSMNTPAATTNDIILGIIIIALSFWSAMSGRSPERAVGK